MPNEELKNKILAKIRAHEVTMRPKAYFTVKVAALAVVTLAALLVSVLILNFILFSIRIGGLDAMLDFFPWALLFVDVVLIGALQALVRQFHFGYSTPTIYVLLGVIVVITSVGIFIDRGTPLNDRLLDRADRHELPPPFGDIYRGVHMHERGGHPPPPPIEILIPIQ